MLPLSLLDTLTDAEGDRGADAEARRVVLTVRLKVGRLEKEEEAEGKDVPLSENDVDSVPQKEAVGGPVAVAASEALTGEVEGEGVKNCDGDVTGEAVAQALSLALSKPLLLADTHPDALGLCEAVGVALGVSVSECKTLPELVMEGDALEDTVGQLEGLTLTLGLALTLCDTEVEEKAVPETGTLALCDTVSGPVALMVGD